jgi:ABC-type multidrug transport system ATPase subunit
MILGEPCNRIHRLQGRLSVVFDTAISLPGLTANQNLDYVRHLLGHKRGRGNAEVLEAVDLSEYANSRVSSLSLGQAKRLAIAGALLGEPELLVLDEPLSGLDTMGVRRMLRLFNRLREQGMTMLLSSHRLAEMQRVVTHVGILYGGRIEREGEIGELLGHTGTCHVLDVGSLERTQRLLESLEGVEFELIKINGRERLVVSSGAVPIAELNRRLVQENIEVSGIEPRVHTLQSVFEHLVDSHEADA